MHLHFTTLCVAMAASRVASSHAAPSWSNPKLPHYLPGVPIKRHLRSDKQAADESERGSTPSDILQTSKKILQPETNFWKQVYDLANKDVTPELLKEQEQLAESVESEKEPIMELLELLKEQEPLTKSITSEDKQLEMLNDWNEISASFTSQLKTPKGEEFKKLKEGGTYEAKENLDKLLDGWNLKNENSNSESMSSTKGLQAWLKSEKSPVELLMVLGIHKAVDRLANRLLISMNLEKWNFAMQLSDGTGRYNFEDKLKETLKAFCGDDNLATLFLKRLVVLRKKSDPTLLKWLHTMKEPTKAYKEMMVVNKDDQFVNRKLAQWNIYVDAYNDLYPQHQTTLSACLLYSKEKLIEKILHGTIIYPHSGDARRDPRVMG